MYWTDASCTVMSLASAVLLLELAVLVHSQLGTLTRYSEYRSSETLVSQGPLESSTISPHYSIIRVLPYYHFYRSSESLFFVFLINLHFVFLFISLQGLPFLLKPVLPFLNSFASRRLSADGTLWGDSGFFTVIIGVERMNLQYFPSAGSVTPKETTDPLHILEFLDELLLQYIDQPEYEALRHVAFYEGTPHSGACFLLLIGFLSYFHDPSILWNIVINVHYLEVTLHSTESSEIFLFRDMYCIMDFLSCIQDVSSDSSTVYHVLTVT